MGPGRRIPRSTAEDGGNAIAVRVAARRRRIFVIERGHYADVRQRREQFVFGQWYATQTPGAAVTNVSISIRPVRLPVIIRMCF